MRYACLSCVPPEGFSLLIFDGETGLELHQRDFPDHFIVSEHDADNDVRVDAEMWRTLRDKNEFDQIMKDAELGRLVRQMRVRVLPNFGVGLGVTRDGWRGYTPEKNTVGHAEPEDALRILLGLCDGDDLSARSGKDKAPKR